MGLNGTIPSEFGDLKLLESIGLFDYGLHGTLPSELGELKQLTSMAFTQSSLTGTIPESFGQSRMLQWLAIMYSNIMLTQEAYRQLSCRLHLRTYFCTTIY